MMFFPGYVTLGGLIHVLLMAEVTTIWSLEDLVFPEISYDMIDKTRGLGISITTTAKTDEEAFELLKALGSHSWNDRGQ